MAPTCVQKTDGLAQQICEHLTDPKNGYPLGPQGLDEGTEEIVFIKNSNGFGTRLVRRGRGDGQWSPPEIYQKIWELSPRIPRLAAFLKGKIEIPWIDATRPPPSASERGLRCWLQKQILSIGKDLERRGLQKGSFAFTMAFGEALFKAMVAPRGRGGLGLHHDPDSDKPQRGLGAIYREGSVNCQEFTLLFLWAARRAQIDVHVVATYKDGAGNFLNHVSPAFKNPRTRKIEKIADIQGHYFGPPRKGDIWGEIPGLDFWAGNYLGMVHSRMDPARAEALIDQGLRLAPNSYLLLYNKGYYRLKAKDLSGAKDYFLKSIAVNPQYPHSYHYLYTVAQALGDEALARWAEKQYFTVNPPKE